MQHGGKGEESIEAIKCHRWCGQGWCVRVLCINKESSWQRGFVLVLMLWYPGLEILFFFFIFELVFCEPSRIGKQSMCVDSRDMSMPNCSLHKDSLSPADVRHGMDAPSAWDQLARPKLRPGAWTQRDSSYSNSSSSSRSQRETGRALCPQEDWLALDIYTTFNSLAWELGQEMLVLRQQTLLWFMTKQSVRTVLTVRHIKEILDFFKLFRVSDSESENIAKQIFSGLEI